MKRTIQITLVLLAIINIAFTQTSLFLDSENGKDNNCGTQNEPCIGLLSLPSLTDEGTSIIFAPGVYSTLNNFPYSVSNANVTFHGQTGVIFQCDTEGTTNCLTITSPHGPSTIAFQFIQFSGFNPNENGTEPMISITAPYTVQSFHSVLHTSSSVVQFIDCEFSSNTFTFPPFTPPNPTDPPTGNQFPHTHFHPTQLININGVYVEIIDTLFAQNFISAISAEYAHLSIQSTTFTQSFTNFSSQLISSSNSVVSITDGTITQNGLNNWETLITLTGVACYFNFDDDFFSTECLPNIIQNTQIANNLNTAIIIELSDGAWIQVTNSTFKENAAVLAISSQYSPVAVRVELNEVSFTDNNYGIVSALYAAGSSFDSVYVNGVTGNETIMTFFEIPPGSSLSINNLQFNASVSPFSIVQASVVMNNSMIYTTSQLVPNIGGDMFPTTVYFENTQFTLPNQLTTVQGLTNVYFDGCTFTSIAQIAPLTCFENSTQSSIMIFFVGEENQGFYSSFCSNIFCDNENEDLCSNGATVNDDNNSNSNTSEIIAWVLASILLVVVIVLGALLGFVGFKYYQLRRDSSYSSL